jgi:hypothetical protein
MEASLLEIRKTMAQRAWNQTQATSQQQREQAAVQMAEQEEMVASARAEVSKTEDAYQKFKGQTGNILNGTANGIAAGLTSGMIAGERPPDPPPSTYMQLREKTRH